MIRCLVVVTLCALLHTVGTEGLGLGNALPLSDSQLGLLEWYAKWGLTLWAVFEVNATASQWAERRWIWSDDSAAWDWQNEIAVVTGGSNGIGASVVRKLVSHGVKVAVLDVEPLSSTFRADELKLVRYYRCDVTSQDAIHDAGEAVRSDLGPPSILINNAGIGNASTILEISPEQLRKIFEINILSHWSTVQEFLPDMLTRKKGHIMGVASLASFVTLASAVDYSCTKSALLSFHEGLAAELKHRYKVPQIKTTIVHPGWTKSALTAHPATQAGLKRIGVKLLEADDVAAAMVKQIISAKSGQLVLGPSITSRLRALPAWVQEVARDSQAYVVNGSGTTAMD